MRRHSRPLSLGRFCPCVWLPSPATPSGAPRWQAGSSGGRCRAAQPWRLTAPSCSHPARPTPSPRCRARRTARLSAAQPLCAAPQLLHRSPLIFHRSPPLSSLAAPPAPRTRRLFFGGGSMESEKLNASAGMATRAEMESGATGELSRAAAAAAVPSEQRPVLLPLQRLQPTADQRSTDCASLSSHSTGEHLFGDKIPGRLRDRRSPMAPETQGVGEGAPSAPPRDDPPFSADGFPAGHIGVSDEQGALAVTAHCWLNDACLCSSERDLASLHATAGKRSYMEDRHTAIPTFRLPGAADPGLLRQARGCVAGGMHCGGCRSACRSACRCHASCALVSCPRPFTPAVCGHLRRTLLPPRLRARLAPRARVCGGPARHPGVPGEESGAGGSRQLLNSNRSPAGSQPSPLPGSSLARRRATRATRAPWRPP